MLEQIKVKLYKISLAKDYNFLENYAKLEGVEIRNLWPTKF